MENVKKSWLERLRDRFELLEIKRKRHQSIWYIGYVSFAFFVYLVMLLFGLFVHSNSDILSTKAGETITIGDSKYTLITKQLDRKKQEAFVAFGNQNPDVSDLTVTVHATVEFMDASQNQSSMQLYAGDKGYYAITIKHLPDKWKALRIQLTEEGSTQGSVGSIVLSNQTEKSTSIPPTNEQDVLIASLNYQVQQKKKEIQALDESTTKTKQAIEKQKEKIKTVNEEMTYQTEKEKKLSEGTIDQLKETMKQYQATIRNNESEKTELRNQIEKVENRIKDEKKGT